MNKKRIALWIGFVSSLTSTIVFGLMLFTEYFDTDEYVILDKKKTNQASISSFGKVKSSNDYGVHVVKSNKVKANTMKAFVDDGLIVEKQKMYHTFSGCSLPNPPNWPQPCPSNPIPTQPTNPNEPNKQIEDWGRKQLQVKDAWLKTKAENINLCVLDTGIDKKHPDLKHIEGQDFTGEGDYADFFGHGSHVAGIIAAIDNGIDTVGVSASNLYIGKVLSSDGSGSLDAIASGIRWCIQRKTHIISMSLGGPQYSEILDQVTKEAQSAGVFVVAAAGNDSGPTNYPAALRQVIAVGATDQSGRLANFSSRGKIETCAPGVDIVSTVPTGPYKLEEHVKSREVGKMSGTSQATPYVSGILALALASGKNVGFTQGDPGCGNGIVNALKTVNQ